MAINLPDLIQHNNVSNYPIADSDSVRGGTRSAVAAVTDLYTIPTNLLKQNATRVWVTAASKFYTLTDIANAGNSAGWTADATGGGSGTVTSVDISGGTTGLTTSGGPITTSGTITLSGTLAIANGGTGASTAATARTNIGLGNVENTALSTWSGSANIVTVGTITTGIWNGSTIPATKGGTGQSAYILGDILYGTTNALSRLSGNTSSNKLFLSQTGTGAASAAPAWSQISFSDITSGTLGVANGGTGIASTGYTNGQLLIGNGTTGGLVAATLTAGANVSITNSAGAITINSSAGGFSGLTTNSYVYADSSTTMATDTGGNRPFRDSVTSGMRHSFYNASDGAYGGGTVINGIVEVQTDASSTAEKVTVIRSGIGFGSPGDWVKFSGYFKFAANGNNKTVKLRLTNASNGNIDLTLANTAASGSVVYAEVLIFKPTATSICTMGFVRSTTASVETVLDKTTTTGLTGSTTSWDVKTVIQTTTAGAAAGNVIQRDVLLEWGPVGG